MFNAYEIKKINQEEVLILYIALDEEFARINNNKKTTIKEEIKKYIKNNKIPFYGKKIALVAGGVLISTIIFTSPIVKQNNVPKSYQYSNSLIIANNEEANLKENELVLEKIDAKDENVVNEINKNENITNTIKEDTNKIINETNQNTNTIVKEDNKIINETDDSTNNTNKETMIETTINTDIFNNLSTQDDNISSTKEIQNDQNTINNELTISIYRSSGIIETLKLEEYIVGVVAAEMPASFNIEALKAQAVAARTYALKSIQDNVILTDTVKTQAYKDVNELKKLWGSSFNTYYNKIKNAVEITKGQVMTYNGSYINAFYHSTSNGQTEDATAVFGYYPYLVSVESNLDKNVASYEASVTFTYEEISNKLSIPITLLSEFTIQRNSTNHVSKIIIDNHVYGGVEFRTILGLRSTDFIITKNNENISITTYGYGHGVGMSQYGANEYAKIGWSYDKILKHYYTGIDIITI